MQHKSELRKRVRMKLFLLTKLAACNVKASKIWTNILKITKIFKRKDYQAQKTIYSEKNQQKQQSIGQLKLSKQLLHWIDNKFKTPSEETGCNMWYDS